MVFSFPVPTPAVQWRGLIGGQGNAGMRPERRIKPGMDGGLTAASLVSPLHHLRTGQILSKTMGSTSLLCWQPRKRPTTMPPFLRKRNPQLSRPRRLCGNGEGTTPDRTSGQHELCSGVISDESLAQVRRPDRGITVQILETFSDYDDYQAWLPTTVSRGLARKAKSITWGLYLADAKNQAENLK